MSGQAFVIVPPPGMKVILPNQGLSPSAINWLPGSTQNGDQPVQTMDQTNGFAGGTGTAGSKYTGHGIATLRGSPKVLGAIQILIGLVHLTFGSLLFMLSGLYMSNIMFSKYLFWGGILFIFSGSFLVLAERYQASCVWKGSLALNIISSLVAVAGTFAFLVDILYFPGDEYQEHQVEWKIAEGLSNTILFFAILEFFIGIVASRSIYDALHHQGDEFVGLGLNVLLLVFSSLEFCITIWTAHFRCQATSSSCDMGMMVTSYTVKAGGVVPAEARPSPPPRYDSVVSAQK